MDRWKPPNYLEDSNSGAPLSENPLLAVVAATISFANSTIEQRESVEQSQSPDFETWLTCNLGSEVLRRIAENRHSVPLEQSAAHFDTTDDVQQKALVWLWQIWQADPEFSRYGKDATCLSHQSGILTKMAVWNARCLYAKRRREGREKQADLLFEDGNENPAINLASAAIIRATDIREHDRLTHHSDKKADVQNAIERVINRMISQHSIAKGNHRRIPIEHITRTIVEGHMYHYTDRYSQTGTFRQFCEAKGVSKNQIAKWRPVIFEYLREELRAYEPGEGSDKTQMWRTGKQPNRKSGTIVKVRRPKNLSNSTAYHKRLQILKAKKPLR